MAQQNSDLLAQVAAQTHRADTAELERDTEKARADKAEGELASIRHKLTELEKTRIDSSELDKLKATVAGLTTQLAAANKARMDAEAPERLRAAVKTRVALETSAQAVLGDTVRLDDIGDRELMTTVIEKLHGRTIDASRSDDYVRARYDAAIEGHAAGSAVLARVSELAAVKTTTEERVDAKSARQRMIERNQNAWQQPAQGRQ